MKKLLIGIPVMALLMTHCKPESIEIEPLSSFSVTNAAPGSPTFNVRVDDIITNPNVLAFRTTTVSKSTVTLPYLPVSVGERELKFTSVENKADLFIQKILFEHGKSYSAFLYDTLQNATLKFVMLNDDLSLPSRGNTNYRFIHLAPNAGAVDVTLVRTSATPNDSVTISNKNYIGANPDVNQLSAFSAIPGGTYTAKIKRSGTQNVIAAFPLSTALSADRIVTLYISGTAQGTPLAASSIRHF